MGGSSCSGFKAAPTNLTLLVEAKKKVMAKEWLEDAYKGYYGHGGCCAVCHRGWNRDEDGEKSCKNLFPLDGKRGAPKLFHLNCLEGAKAQYPNTWEKYQLWKETGELEEAKK